MNGGRHQPRAPLFMAHVAPGLEELAWEELRERLDDVRRVATWSGFDRRASVLLFRTSEPPKSLLSLRLSEDVFAVVALMRRLPPGKAGLRELARLTATAEVDEALRCHREVVVGRSKRRPTYRVVTRVAGQQDFRRADAQRACEGALARRFPRWRLVEDDAPLEFWLQVVGEEGALALRLSNLSMRQRAQRDVNLPKALKPTVAHALVRLARRARDGYLVDPMCGGGTVLAEAAGLGLRVVGGDLRRSAVRAAQANLAGRRPGLVRWDATRLPLRDRSVAALACNLPWGGEGDLAILYRRILAEAKRVVVPRRRIVLLTSERALLERLARQRGLAVERSLRVVVRGADAWIVVLVAPD